MRNDEEIRDISGKERDFLSRLRARPGMYLTANSFQRLISFLDGYRVALYTLDLDDDHCIRPGRDFIPGKVRGGNIG